MDMTSSRENKTPTTFWMEKEIKREAQETARTWNLTMTDLINEAVNYYIKNIAQIDPDRGKKIAQTRLTEAVLTNAQLIKLERDYQDLDQRIDSIKNSLDQEVREIREYIREQFGEMENQIDRTIKIHMDHHVVPVTEKLAELLSSSGLTDLSDDT